MKPHSEPSQPCDFVSDDVPTTPLVMLLEQLADVVRGLSDAQYAQKPVGVFGSSVGAHVRHCLDHVSALLNAADTGVLNYDHRERGTNVETSCDVVLELICDLQTKLKTTRLAPDRMLTMSTLLSSGGPPLIVQTSLGREASFVVSHTVHHNALIGAMVKTLGGILPDRFGYAPSTPTPAQGDACVR